MAEWAAGGDVQVRLTLRDDMSQAAATALDALRAAALRTNKTLTLLGGSGLGTLSRDAVALRGALDGAASSLSAMAGRSRNVGNNLRSAQRGGEKLRSSLDAASAAGRRMSSQMAAMRQDVNKTAMSVQGLSRNLGGVMGTGVAGTGAGAGKSGRGRWALAVDMYGKGRAGLRAGQEALARPLSFEAEVARYTNEFYRGQSVEERGRTRERVRDATEQAARAGGGTREQALQALGTMRDQGLDQDAALQVLGAVQKGATAHGVDPAELARVVALGINSGQFKPGEVERALDKALASMGDSGTVEEWLRALPPLFEAGAGTKGSLGYEAALVSLSGVSRVTGGDAGRAGEITAGLVRSMETDQVRQAFSERGVNLDAELGGSRGGERVTAMAARADQLMAGDQNYEQLKSRLAAAGDDVTRSELAGQLTDYTQDKALGQVFQNRDDRLALMGVVTQRAAMGEAADRMRDPLDYTQRSFAVVQDTTAHKAQQLGNDRDKAVGDLLDTLKGPLDGSLDGLHELSAAFPQLAEAVYGAGAALDLFEAAGGGTGGGGGIGTAVGGMLSAGGKVLKGAVGRLGPVAAVMSAVDAVRTESDPSLTRAGKNTEHAATLGGLGGAMTGAAMGAAVGSVAPVVGTAIGGLVGGLLGYFGGSSAGRAVGEELFGADEAPLGRLELSAAPVSQASRVEPPQPGRPTGGLPTPVVNLTATLRVDSYDLACAVERLNAQHALRA